MKRGTPRHPKMADLAGRLNICRSWAVGIMECLWHWAAEFCPTGRIDYEPRVIADVCDWPRGDAARLVEALVETGWLDTDEDGWGWIIHDWPQHCEDVVHRKLWVDRKRFAKGEPPKIHALDSKDRAAAHEFYTAPQIAEGEKPGRNRGDPPETPQDRQGETGEDLGKPLPLPLPVPLPSSPLPPVSSEECLEAEAPVPNWRDRVWAEVVARYPKQARIRRRLDLQLFLSEVETEQDGEGFLSGLSRHCQCQRWLEGYVPDLQRFIRERMWLEEPPAPRPSAQKGGLAWDQV